MDGTLLHVRDEHHRSVQIVMRRIWGIDSEAVEVRPDGLSQVEYMRRVCRAAAVPEPQIAAHIDRAIGELPGAMVALLPADLSRRVLPGALTLLECVDGLGIPRALVTGSLGLTVDVLLERSGLARFFPVRACGHERDQRVDLIALAIERAAAHYSLNPDDLRLVALGDAPPDISAGRACGARVVSVASGDFDRAALAAHGPDVLLDDLTDTGAALAALLD
mgnify:CR=1 FL=1